MINSTTTTKYINNASDNVTFQENLELSTKWFNIYRLLQLETDLVRDDIFKLKFKDITENKLTPNTFTLRYFSSVTNKVEEVEIGVYLKAIIDTYKMYCFFKCGFVSNHIFYNYFSGALYDKRWLEF